MKAPKLDENRCSIIIAEHKTGHVYKKDLTLFQNGDRECDVFLLFDNFNNAKEFALNFIKNQPEFECSIYNYTGEHLATFDKNGERKW